nr:ATP-grasp domain-containing protein [Glycomyces terrestris]
MTALLLCSDPLASARSRRPDPHFARDGEHAATVAVIDHDALVRGDVEDAVRRVPAGLGPAWYRGWMLTASRYADLEAALADRGCLLLTTASAYARAHELPGWYPVFAGHTPASVHTADLAAVEDWLARAAAELGAEAAIVKDFVKSRKDAWDTACHIPDLGDTEQRLRVVNRFMELQGADLYGGVVLRAFEDFAAATGATRQARVWWLDGEPVQTTAHPDTPQVRVSPDLTGLDRAVAALGCRFVTTDLARRSDGVWRVIEVGDGQVSDFPSGTDIGPLIKALTAARPPA